ncbi:MAG: 4-hydroxy-tetrahydrodipicolinate reductase [Actinobacteria bacterium]|nr:4-hydroxy-tetrahydrodipicolinate reductase [Actinomycetota bacterium]
MRVGVFGAAGRMGAEVCRAVSLDPQLDLVAALDPHHAGLDLRQVTGLDTDLHVVGDPSVLEAAAVDVAVDFTEIAAARANLDWCADHGVHAVVGTTGFTDADLAHVGARFGDAGTGCVIAPNFAIGAVLMMRFAELASPWFDTAEVIELHHDAKLDAPSGTAMTTVERMAAASSTWAPDPTRDEVVAGARGAEAAPGIRVHSVRLRGLVAHQEVLLGTTGQSLTIRHDSYDRTSFMPGVLLAIKEVPDRPGLTIGLEPILGLD